MYMCTIYIYGTYHICINIKPMAGIKVILISIESESKELAVFSKIQILTVHTTWNYKKMIQKSKELWD